MVRPGRDRLNGIVEVDESYIGGLEEGVRGRRAEKKAIVAIAAEARGKRAIGRIRLQRIPDVSAPSLEAFPRQAIEVGSTAGAILTITSTSSRSASTGGHQGIAESYSIA